MVPQFPAVPIPELNIASSEELLQTLQSLDITKITSVLKSLGEAGAAANISLNIQPQFVPSPPPPHPPSVRQVPAKSDAILGHPLRPTKECAPSNDSASMSKDEHNPDHAHMLANVWMNAAKLAEMVKTQGVSAYNPLLRPN